MKEITIKIRTDENNIATAMQIVGLKPDSIEDKLYLIGLLENIKQMELQKLSTKAAFKKTGDDSWKNE